MFTLAEVAVKIELSRRDISRDVALMESRVVMTTLLADVDDYDPIESEAICNMLITLASTNGRFADALESIVCWLETEDGKTNYADECPKYSILSSILKTAEFSKMEVAA